MPEPFYLSHVAIRKIEGVHRRADLPAGVSIEIGVHGPIRDHYRLVNAKNLPLPVDYVVAATGG